MPKGTWGRAGGFLPRVQQSAGQGIPARLLVPHGPGGTLYSPGGTARLLASQAHAAACTCWGKCCSVSKEKQHVPHCAPIPCASARQGRESRGCTRAPLPLVHLPGLRGGTERSAGCPSLCGSYCVCLGTFLPVPGHSGHMVSHRGHIACPATAPPPRAHTAWGSGAHHQALALHLQAV